MPASFGALLDRTAQAVMDRLCDVSVSIVSGEAEPVLCNAILDRNIEVYGDLGQVIARRDMLTFAAQHVPSQVRGAVVTEQGGAGRVWTLDRVAEDDGRIVKVFAQ